MAQKKKQVGPGIGAAVALSVAAVAGAYYLYGKDGAKHRRMVRSWMFKLKGEVLDRLEKMSEVNQDVYHKTIDQVATRYEGLKNIDKAELAAVIVDLKKHWNNISRQIKEGQKNNTPKKKRATKRSTKKSAKSA